MSIHNHNEPITHLALPDRKIPILLTCDARSREGFTALADVSPDVISVRKMSGDALRMFVDGKRKEQFEKKYGSVSSVERRRLFYMLELADVLIGRDVRKLRQLVARYVSEHEWQDRVLQEIARSPLHEFQKNLNLSIQHTRFVVWWAEREKKLAPGLLAPDTAGALSALALWSVGQPGGIGVCQWPQCREPFIRTHSASKQKYDSSQCQAAAGMARMRLRAKRKSHGR